MGLIAGRELATWRAAAAAHPRSKPKRLAWTVHPRAHQRTADAQSSQKYSGRTACQLAARATHLHGCGWVARAAIRHAALADYFWLDCAPGLR